MGGSFLIIGLGSMGKRRIRNLKALGVESIHGFDIRKDRRDEARINYSISTYNSLEEALGKNAYSAIIISVPPGLHHIYMEMAIEKGISFFVEASVVDTGLKHAIDKLKHKNIIAAPSSTLYFHPAIQKIFQIIKAGTLGSLSNILYHSGGYLPDWHTYEKVSDFYVSKKETGGAREIVPFELTWITKLLGFPAQLTGTYKKTIEIEGADQIDDTYNAILDYGNFTVILSVDVVTRCPVRRLFINGSEKQLVWDWEEACIKIFHHDRTSWEIIHYEAGVAEKGYNKNITEQMYIDEMNCFLESLNGKIPFVNTLESDLRVLGLLYSIENSYLEKRFLKIVA